ncbi:sensor histidine kinase [Clostridium felsineum]|uniref:sensor histidine kinase n=1 Tax=Clostridium felsineum TaxID=36839 RepID=UPI00098BD4F9|nr:HAMP domain-containing sensor histidine kinase [Clostridium felsineum]
MNRKHLCSRLEIKLIISIIFSLVVALSIFVLLENIGDNILDNYFDKNYFVENQKKKTLTDFKEYISENHIKMGDTKKISQWANKKKYVNLYIYKDNKLIYDHNMDDVDEYTPSQSPVVVLDKELYNIKFSDEVGKVYLECFFQYKYYSITSLINVTVSFLCFVVIMVFFIRRKTRYIKKLERELKILEGGNLDYEITIKGNDELFSLAQGINEMRKSFVEKLESEEKARLANTELITAMSHDLRTPLTALVGYLDIIEYKKYKTEENLKQYIHNSREKAYQIKCLSDKLFEYFIVFNTADDNIELESFNGNELLDQLLSEQIFILEDAGFNFKFQACNEPFKLKVNLISIRRVFDNIFSNISKYADKSEYIKVQYYIEASKLFICIENKINSNLKDVTSTGIGLKTCKKIIKQHKGKVISKSGENIFLVKISLPIT